MKATTLPTLREYFKYLFSQYSKSEITGIVLAESFHKFEQFTAQELALWMFVPCNSKGEPMQKPEDFYEWCSDFQYLRGEKETKTWKSKCEKYQKALDACIFEGWEYTISDRLFKDHYYIHILEDYFQHYPSGDAGTSKTGHTIEDLITAKIPLTLKPNHAEELGLTNEMKK